MQKWLSGGRSGAGVIFFGKFDDTKEIFFVVKGKITPLAIKFDDNK